MKSIYIYIITGIFIGLMSACKEEIPEIEKLPVLKPSSADSKAINWKTVLDLDYQGFINMNPAAEINSTAYQNELNEVVEITKARTAHQAKAAEYWSAGAVIRWNEIA